MKVHIYSVYRLSVHLSALNISKSLCPSATLTLTVSFEKGHRSLSVADIIDRGQMTNDENTWEFHKLFFSF